MRPELYAALLWAIDHWVALSLAAAAVLLVALPPRWDPAIRLKEWLSRR